MRIIACGSSCCARLASIFRAAARSAGFSMPRPNISLASPGTSRRRRAAVIAASRGYCFGVGFELALACDFRLVTESTVYALPEQRLGMIPGSGGAARLQKMVGITRAKDIVM